MLNPNEFPKSFLWGYFKKREKKELHFYYFPSALLPVAFANSNKNKNSTLQSRCIFTKQRGRSHLHNAHTHTQIHFHLWGWGWGCGTDWESNPGHLILVVILYGNCLLCRGENTSSAGAEKERRGREIKRERERCGRGRGWRGRTDGSMLPLVSLEHQLTWFLGCHKGRGGKKKRANPISIHVIEDMTYRMHNDTRRHYVKWKVFMCTSEGWWTLNQIVFEAWTESSKFLPFHLFICFIGAPKKEATSCFNQAVFYRNFRILRESVFGTSGGGSVSKNGSPLSECQTATSGHLKTSAIIWCILITGLSHGHHFPL